MRNRNRASLPRQQRVHELNLDFVGTEIWKNVGTIFHQSCQRGLKHESDVKNFDVICARFSAARLCISNAFGLPKSGDAQSLSHKSSDISQRQEDGLSFSHQTNFKDASGEVREVGNILSALLE